MGGFEPKAKPWTVDPIPSTFQFELLDEDWDQFEPLMTAAIHRTPCLETAQGQDAAQRARELHARRQLHPRRGARAAQLLRRRRLQLGGHRQLGRRRQADRRMDRRRRAAERPRRRRHPPLRRRTRANKKALAERTGETLGLHYAMRWPRQELETARPLRTSPLYDLLAAKGAIFGAKNGWERASYFRAAGAAATPAVPAHARPSPPGSPTWSREQRATRQAVALYDQTSFGKMLLQGRDALAVLQRLCANEMDVAPGRMVYTPMLNERGGFESDVTVTRLGVDRFLIVTGSAQTPRDLDWIARHTRAGEAAALVDVSAMTVGPLADGAERAHPARPRRRGRHLRRARARAAALRDDARDRPRLRARSRRAHELRRRPGLRALRADRDGAPRLARAARGERGPRHRRRRPRRRRLLRARRACASRPVGAPGAPSSARTRRRSRPARCSRSSSPSATTSSARRRSSACRTSRCARSSSPSSSTRAMPTLWGGEALVVDGAAGRRDLVGGLERRGRPLRRPRLRSRRGRGARPRRQRDHRRPVGRRGRGIGVGFWSPAAGAAPAPR